MSTGCDSQLDRLLTVKHSRQRYRLVLLAYTGDPYRHVCTTTRQYFAKRAESKTRTRERMRIADLPDRLERLSGQKMDLKI